jgi:prostaglandin-E synthase 1
VLVQPAAALAIALFATYAVARILHSVCYVKSIQPFRTMFFAIGMLAQITMIGVLLWQVFAG